MGEQQLLVAEAMRCIEAGERMSTGRFTFTFTLHVAVVVEAPAALLAQVPRRHHPAEQRAGAVLVVAQAVVQHLEDREADVEPDEVGQRQRAHRVRHAELHHRVDRLGRGHAFHHAEDRLVDHRHEHPVGDEAGVVVAPRPASCPARGRSPSPCRWWRRWWRGPRMTSTSCITGTGFMKCMPITCSGRRVRAAISVIEIELVLVARIASGRGDPVELLEERRT